MGSRSRTRLSGFTGLLSSERWRFQQRSLALTPAVCLAGFFPFRLLSLGSFGHTASLGGA